MSDLPATLPLRRPMLLRTDARGLTQWVNGEFVRNTGFTLRDLLGKKPGAVLQTPASSAAAIATMSRAIASGAACSGVELENRRRDGSVFLMRVDIEPEHDAAGRLVAFHAVVHDVGAQASQQQEWDWLRSWHESARLDLKIGHYERDLDGGSGRWDAAMFDIWEAPAEAGALPLAQQFERLMEPDRSLVRQRLAAASSPGARGQAAFRIVRPGGGTKHLQSAWVVSLAPSGHRVLHGIHRDVTDTLLAEQRADLLDRCLLLAAELGNIGLTRQNLVTDEWEGNDTARRLAGEPPEAISPFRMADFVQRVHPDDRDALVQARQRAIAEPGTAVGQHLRVVGRDGELRYLHALRVALPHPEGPPREMISVNHDETDAVNAAQRERELAAERRLVLDIAGLGSWKVLGPQQPLSIDARMRELFGLADDAEQVDPQTLAVRMVAQDRAAFLQLLASVFDGSQPHGAMQLRLIGTTAMRWLEVQFRRVAGPGRPQYFGTVQDVTERERQLRRMTALFDHALNGILLTDEHQRIADANPAACQCLGYSLEELRGMPRHNLLTLAAGDERERVTWDAFLHEGHRRGQATLRRRDGSTLVVDFASVADVLPGLHMHAIVDATARLAAEQQLQRLLAHQQADFEAMRDELARDVHDELGQALGALALEADVLAARHGAEVEHLRAVIQDAVTATRDLSRTLSSPFADRDLCTALQHLAHTVSRRSEIDVTLRCEMPHPLPEAVVRGVYRVAQEALNNAVKHAAARQAQMTLVVTAPADHAPHRPGPELSLEVSDDGAGFDPARLAAVQHGRGLAGMRQRAELLGGVLEVHSAPGAGTRVCLRAPLEAAGMPPSPNPASAS